MSRSSNPARRARLHLILATISAGLTVLAALTPQWIEKLTGLEPDGGNGILEWLLPLPFAISAAVLAGLGYRAHRAATRSNPGR